MDRAQPKPQDDTFQKQWDQGVRRFHHRMYGWVDCVGEPFEENGHTHVVVTTDDGAQTPVPIAKLS